MIIRHEVGVLRLKRIPIFLLFLLPATLTWLSCGNAAPSGAKTSGLKYRAFISNSVSAGTSLAGVYIVDAENDIFRPISPISAGTSPGMMVVTPNLGITIVFSGNGTQTSQNQLTFINNATEASAGQLTLPGVTESIVVSPDSSTGYAAVPTAPVVGQSPGVVDIISLTTGTLESEIDVPSVHYLSINNSGNRLLGFSDDSDSLSIITPSQAGIGNAVTQVGGFNRPVQAFFSSDDSTAYVLNCGPECGGTQASLQTLDLTTNTPGPAVNLPAGTVALINGSTMYVAGTPHAAGGAASLLCPAGTTAALYCGELATVDLPTMSVTNTVVITDGYHNRMAMAANGQLFLGARTCTEVVAPIPPPAGAEVRGCLSIYNTLPTPVGNAPAGGVLIPPANGDATGIQPIPTRQVVYVVQGGSLDIYDATTDALQETQITNIVGQFIDVKTVDF